MPTLTLQDMDGTRTLVSLDGDNMLDDTLFLDAVSIADDETCMDCGRRIEWANDFVCDECAAALEDFIQNYDYVRDDEQDEYGNYIVVIDI
jgi:predicted amidophosphoribosyltransferase